MRPVCRWGAIVRPPNAESRLGGIRLARHTAARVRLTSAGTYPPTPKASSTWTLANRATRPSRFSKTLNRHGLLPVTRFAPQLDVASSVRASVRQRDDVIELQPLARSAIDATPAIAPPDLAPDALRDWLSPARARPDTFFDLYRGAPPPLQAVRRARVLALRDPRLGHRACRHQVGRRHRHRRRLRGRTRSEAKTEEHQADPDELACVDERVHAGA